MKKKGKIVGFSIFIVTICALTFLASKTFTKNETLGDTGWTVDQFIEWAYEVQPVVAHRRWNVRKGGYVFQHVPGRRGQARGGRLKKVWKEGGRRLMEPNEPFPCQIINDLNDVLWICRHGNTYNYEWDFRLPPLYDRLPEPVKKVLHRIRKEDIGKTIGEILPYAAKPVAICASKKGKPVSSEDVIVRLLGLSDDKLKFTVETEPFILSDNPDFTGNIGDKVFLYVYDNSEVGICKPEKRKGVNHEK